VTTLLQQHLFAAILVVSVALHAAAGYLGYSPIQPPKLKPVQSGRASISLRSTVAAGPKSGKGASDKLVAKAEKESKPEPKPEPPPPPKVEKPAETRPPVPDRPAVKPKESPKEKDKPKEKPKEDKPKEKPKEDKPKEKPKETPPKSKASEPKEKNPAEPRKVDVIAAEETLPSRGSVGSRGAEVDGLPGNSAYNQAPAYPPELLAARVEGTVMLWVKLDARGRVKSVHVHKSSGYEAFDQSALETVRQWEFDPATRRGVPVSYEFLKPIEFQIRRSR
jgi:protein TonB